MYKQTVTLKAANASDGLCRAVLTGHDPQWAEDTFEPGKELWSRTKN